MEPLEFADSYRNRIQIARALVLLESAVILFFSFQSIAVMPAGPLRTGDIEHLVAYFVYGSLLYLSALKPGKRALLAALLTGSLFGLLNEIIQGFLPYRSMDFFDWIIDTAGTGLGALLFYRIKKA